MNSEDFKPYTILFLKTSKLSFILQNKSLISYCFLQGPAWSVLLKPSSLKAGPASALSYSSLGSLPGCSFTTLPPHPQPQHVPAQGPLHLLFSQPELFSSRIAHTFTLLPFWSLLKHPFIGLVSLTTLYTMITFFLLILLVFWPLYLSPPAFVHTLVYFLLVFPMRAEIYQFLFIVLSSLSRTGPGT